MKPLTVEFETLEDFARVTKHTEGLVFVSVGQVFDTLWMLPNKGYPLVFECTVEHDAWRGMERDLHPIPGKIERESA